VPAIDDQYWLERAKKILDETATTRKESTAKLQTFILWLWGAYTGLSILGTNVSGRVYPLWALLLIVSPSVLLIITYWIAVFADSPVVTTFDPKEPDAIRAEYNRSVRVRQTRLTWALLMSLVSALFLTGAIVAASLFKQPLPAYAVDIIRKNELSAEHSIIVARAPHSTTLRFLVRAIKKDGSTQDLPEMSLQSPTSGEVSYAVVLTPDAEAYQVQMEWVDAEGLKHAITRKGKLVKP
jgi:hypothetical protein